jgi:hypothetical protein
MDLRPDLRRTVIAIREQRAQWAQVAGEPLIIPRGAGKLDGRPVLAEPCRCPDPIGDDGTCCKCGRGVL